MNHPLTHDRLLITQVFLARIFFGESESDLTGAGDRHLRGSGVSGGGGDHADQHDGRGQVAVLPPGEGVLLRGRAPGMRGRNRMGTENAAEYRSLVDTMKQIALILFEHFCSSSTCRENFTGKWKSF